MPTEIVEGMSALLVKLKELPNRIANEVVNSALEAGAAPILAAAQANVPVDTGLLKSKIAIWREPVRKNSYLVRVGTELGDYQGKAFYGSFIEYGYHIGKRVKRFRLEKRETEYKGRKSKLVANEAFTGNDTRRFVPARPYMRPAFDQNVHRAIEIIGRELGAAIEREATK